MPPVPPPRIAALPLACCSAPAAPFGGDAGQELPLVAAAFPQHRVVGLDLAEGMVELARALVARRGLSHRVEVRCGFAVTRAQSGAPSLRAACAKWGVGSPSH